MVLGLASGLMVWAGILFPPALGIYALIKWKGKWRAAAVAPMAALIAFVVALVLELRRPGSNADELWGLMFMPIAMLLALYSGVVLILHRRRKA